MLSFRHFAPDFARAAARCRCRVCPSCGPYVLFGVVLLALATIFLTKLDTVGLSPFITAVDAAEGPAGDKPKIGELGPQQSRCLSRQEQRARIAVHDAIPLGKAVRAVKGRGDLLRARLCERRGKLLYLVTILGRSGKVQRYAIDAKTGRVVGSRHRKQGASP